MTSSISKKLMCIVIRNGVEMWLEDDRADKLKSLLTSGSTQFIEFDGEMINRADIVGIFSAHTMEDLIRRKNGGWKCKYNVWHERHGECSCWRNLEVEGQPEVEVTEEERQANLRALAELRTKFNF